jgi:hypothetical protein
VGGGYPGYYSEASQATTALVLSICGLFCCITAPIGAWIAYREKEAIDAGLRDPRNRGQAVAALVIGLSLFVITAGGLLLILGIFSLSG